MFICVYPNIYIHFRGCVLDVLHKLTPESAG